MRQSLLVAGLLSLSLPLWAQVSLVHVTSCGEQTFPSATCTIPATGSGNLIVVGIQLGGGLSTSTTITRVTDNVGNVYAEAGPAKAINTSGGYVDDIWYAKNSVPGATTLTITPNISVSGAGAVIWEFSGIDPSAPLDQTAVLNDQSASTTVSAPPVTTSSSGVVIGITHVQNHVTGMASGNAFINDSTLKGNGWAHLITSAAGTYSAVWLQNSAGIYDSSTVSFKGAGSGPVNACDLATPYGTVDTSDVNASINMALGTSPCTANVAGAGVCNVVVVQRVVNASLPGGTCLTGSGPVSHSATLNWAISVSPNIAGYNVYRGGVSGGPYTKLTSSLVTGTSYTDSTVQSGQTYYYVTTAVDTSSAESTYSNQVTAVIPTP